MFAVNGESVSFCFVDKELNGRIRITFSTEIIIIIINSELSVTRNINYSMSYLGNGYIGESNSMKL